MRRIACTFALSFLAVVPAAFGQNQSAEEAVFAKSGGATRISSAQVFGAYGKLPLSFEANGGQSSPEVKFLTRGLSYALFLTRDGAVLSLQGPRQEDARKRALSGSGLLLPEANELLRQTQQQREEPASVLHMQVLGANPAARIVGADELPGKSNYFIGNDPKNWRPNLSTFAKVKYRDIYPGVDLVYYGNQGRLEYDFVVAPGAEPKKIRLEVAGKGQATENNKEQNFLRIDTNGDLVVPIEGGEVRYQRPVAYQQARAASSNSVMDESKQFVDAWFLLKSGNEVGFEVGPYDATRPLIIDPTLVYSTYLTGNYYENGNAIAVDSSGYAYVTGPTFSSVPTFPVTSGAYQTTCGTNAVCNYNTQSYNYVGNTDAFVTKLSLDGSALVWSTYLGGSYDEAGRGIAVDSSGNVYVAGYTRSSDFPTTTGAFQTTCAPYVTSEGVAPPNCPVYHLSNCGGGGTDGKFSASGVINAFVTKLNSTGTALAYSTFVGGTGNSDVTGLAIDAAGEAYIVGHTDSSGQYGYTESYPACPLGYANAHPTTPSGFMASPGLSFTAWPGFLPNGYLTALSADGKSLVYSTYLGGSTGPYLNQAAVAVAVDSTNAAYVTGYTNSPTFPTTSGAFQTSLNRNGGVPGPNCGGANCLDAFVAKFDPSKSGAASLVYSTFLGGGGNDIGLTIAVDSANNAYVGGQTNYNGAPSPDFPTTAGAFQSSCPAPAPCASLKGFLTKLNAAGSAEVYSSYLGGSSSDGIAAIALDSTGRAYVTGSTNSTNFPNKNAVQLPPPPGASNAFVSVFKADGSDLDFSSFLGGNAYTFGQAIAVDPSENIYLTGYTLDQNFPTTAGAFQTTCAHCGISGTNQAAFVSKISALSSVGQSPLITSSNAATFQVGVAGSFTVTTTGTPTPALTESVTLPNGVTFADNGNGTGTLSGTPAAGTAGTYALMFTASNGVNPNATQNFTLTVSPAGQAPLITSSNAATFQVGVAGSFTVTTTGTPTPALSESVTLPSGLTFVDNGNGTGTLSGVPASGSSGNYVLAFTASNGVNPNATQTFTLTVNQAPAITSANSATFVAASAGSFTVTATGFPKPTLSESGTPPAGVSFNASTGVLSGTPAAGTGGTYALMFTASNGVNPNATQTFTLTVDQSPAITSAPGTAFTIGTAGTFNVTATGFPAPTLSESGTLPLGVGFNPSTGVLSGTPAAGTGGTYPITITASNGISPNAMQNFTLTVKDFSFAAISPTSISVGGSASPLVTVNSLGGFNSPVTLSLSAPPSGVSASLSSASVTPTGSATLNLSLGPSVVASTFNLTVTGVSGSLNHTAIATVTVTANTSTIANVIQQLLSAACIDNSGIGNALTSKLSAAQSYINAGDSLDAINALTALKNQLSAQSGKHIASSCSIGGVAFNAANVLLIDTQSLIDSLRVGTLADPIIGYVVNSSGVGIAGVTVSLLGSGGSTVATATTDITGFYYFATTGGVLIGNANYTTQVAGLPAGFSSASPASQQFAWQGAGITLGSFAVN